MKKFLCTWFGEVCYSCSLTVLPGSVWVVLIYVLQRNFFTSVLQLDLLPICFCDNLGPSWMPIQIHKWSADNWGYLQIFEDMWMLQMVVIIHMSLHATFSKCSFWTLRSSDKSAGMATLSTDKPVVCRSFMNLDWHSTLSQIVAVVRWTLIKTAVRWKVVLDARELPYQGIAIDHTIHQNLVRHLPKN